jgi:hypothetical protein
MSWRAAARAAVIPWLFLVLVGVGIHAWDGMIEYYGWSEYLSRFVPSVALIYPVLIGAVLWNDRRYPRKKPSLNTRVAT